ncbi:MAG: hypothetical protein HY815_02515 [Candidatus Riflebacteria bacterium]|nr:hypothetical protein [Candidatus Riflebacteria bacterium]
MPLAEHFLGRARPDLSLGESARAALKAHRWPGNIRELKNTIERAAALASASVLQSADVLFDPGSNAEASPGAPGRQAPPRSLEEVEKEAIEAALASTGWNKTEASRILGITPKTLREKIERYGIKR